MNYPMYGGYYPNPAYDEAYQREMVFKSEKRGLKKASNGLGFFVLTYYLVMQILAIILALILREQMSSNIKGYYTYIFFIEIFAGIASSLIAVGFYRLLSGRRLSDMLKNSYVKPTTLVPLVFLGMGAAMVANTAASMFDSNISVFGLNNTVDFSVSINSPLEVILYVVSTAVMPALAEELAFRGVFMNIMRKYGDAFAIISSSVIFGAMHGNTTQIIFAFLLGLIFAYIDCKVNSILPSVLVHFLNNFYAVVMDMVQTELGLSETMSSVINIAVVAAFCLLGILSFIYLANSDNSFFRLSNDDKNLFSDTDVLPLKKKFGFFFASPGIIICLCLFFAETVANLIPGGIL